MYLEVVVVDEKVEGAHGREGPTQVLDEDLLLHKTSDTRTRAHEGEEPLLLAWDLETADRTSVLAIDGTRGHVCVAYRESVGLSPLHDGALLLSAPHVQAVHKLGAVRLSQTRHVSLVSVHSHVEHLGGSTCQPVEPWCGRVVHLFVVGVGGVGGYESHTAPQDLSLALIEAKHAVDHQGLHVHLRETHTGTGGRHGGLRTLVC